MDRETFVREWSELAAAKLRADNVDPSDLQAVRKALLATVGGERLFQCWLEFNHKEIETVENLTNKDVALQLLKSSKSEREWNNACDAIKDANSGYPSWWYQEIVLSGLVHEVAAAFGSDGDIHISVQ